MGIFQHHVLVCAPKAAAGVGRQLATQADAVARGAGGRVFGVFTSMIGLGINNLVMLSEFPDEATARGVDLLAGVQAGVVRHEFWEPDPRPTAEERLPETDGFFSHRWFDCAEGDWPRFRDVSADAWDNFEDVHDTRVIGFWRSHTAPAPGVTRVWLMAWYKDLAAWEASRFVLNPVGTRAEQAFANFRARREMTLDSAVSMLRRVT
jgi:hypothetical protein